MTRLLLGILLVYGAVDWIDRGDLTNAALCALVGLLLCISGAHALQNEGVGQ